jgi:molybdopterin synthase sulfur carrier subunit
MGTGLVEINLFAAARAAVGRSTLNAAPATLSAILDDLERQYPPFARVRPQCSFLVDGVAVHEADPDVPAGSRLDVLPPFAGG